MLKKTPRYLKGAASVLLGAILLYLVLRSCDWRAVGRSFSEANPWLLVGALFLIALSFITRGLRLMILTDGTLHQLGSYIGAIFLGLGANNFIPLRIGEVIKAAYIIKKTQASIASAALAILVERILDVACLCGLILLLITLERALILLWWQQVGPAIYAKANWILPAAGAAVSLALIAAVLLAFNFKGWRSHLASHMAGLGQKWAAIKKTGMNRLMAGAAFSAVTWVMDTLFLFLMVRSFDMPVPFVKIFFLQVALAASYAASVSPGAIGLYEWMGVWALKNLGQPETQALAMVLAAHGMGYLVLGAGSLSVLAKESWSAQKNV